MREQILRHLESDWPQTLKDWDKLERQIQFMRSESNEQRIDDHFPEPASAIKLARQFDIPSILPAAFYHLSRLSILDDWDRTHADPFIPIRNPTKRTAQWGLLSAEDFRCLIFGKAVFPEGLRRIMESHDDSPIGLTGKCNPEGLWNDICDRCLQSADPLALLQVESNKSHHCTACTKTLRSKFLKTRREVWDKLGTFFHL